MTQTDNSRGAALMVVPRAIVRDLSTGNDATRLMAAIMLVFSVSPMLARPSVRLKV